MSTIRLGLSAAVLAATLAGFMTGPALAKNRCAVTDPTGTPLNIRETPNGEIIGRVSNGAGVRVVNNSFDERGRPWVLIRPRGSSQIVGWVYREFVSCY
ncbi:SH3 domain-containing protein [Bosea sp. (in: a-proteobacteria)]|uniref:SH3 domain-containing protein n=1 Tax=Bosea sp. (in: a-proteobacteria) TaxID=1871050 RepID=UPI002FCB2F0F